MRSYEAARGLLGFLGFLAWCAIILGIFIAIGAGSAVSQSRSFGIGSGAMAGMMAAMPGLILAFLGFLGLAQVQMGRAGVDTAEYTQQMLKIARDQLEVSKQSLKQTGGTRQSFETLQNNGPVAETAAGGASYEKATPPVSTAPSVSEPKQEYKPGDTITYRTKRIRVVEAGFIFSATVYPTLEDAKAKVDEDGAFLPPEPPLTLTNPDGVDVKPADLSASFKHS
ncbi:MAG: hypothetical protein CMF72_05170 [Mameliella sp.]|nr:hypothetical protein [Mameliella sp.]|tara:strand:- start:1055 stop:1729 length:675 start_codon:yes stop_codon:yes gene_type:complete